MSLTSTAEPRHSPTPDGASSPADAVALLQRGIAAAADERADEAIACFRQAVALRPGLAQAHANLGLLLVATGRHAEAEEPLREALAGMPADATLVAALAAALEATERPAAAEPLYRAVLEARPGNAADELALARCLRRLGRLDEAGARLERLLARDAGAIAARLELGVLQQERDQLDAAIATYRAVLAAQPAQLEALNNLGVCLRQAGALDEARVAFEQVLAASPHRIETHCNLAQLKTYAADDPQVGHLLSLRHRLPGLPAHGRIRYWFSVGKMLEDGGRHDEAFAAYAEGNRLKHAQAPWDEAGHEEAMRRIAGTFSPAWIARSPDACGAELPAGEGLAAHDTGGRVGEVDDRAAGGAAGPIPVFVVGMPRSGTSLIEQVLATLPGVHGAGELTDLPDVLQAAAADHPAGDYRFPETPAGYDDDRLRRLGRRYLERLRVHAPAATHIVDKLPANFAHLGLLHRMLPQARIVHAMRDPMDACFSCFSRLFAADNLAFTYELGALGRYWVTYHRLMRHWHAVLPLGRILDLPYEAMVTDFEAQARRLVAHLGLPWDERCLGFHRNRRVVGTASAAQVRRPIYRSSVARWKAFERHLGPLMDIVGPYR